MRCWLVLLVGIEFAVSDRGILNAEEAATKKLPPREVLRECASEFTYPGGMLFHTAFQRGITTRYILLKASLRSEELNEYFSLDERQRLHAENLRPVKLKDKHRRDLLDENAPPDEQLIEPDYFAFLGKDPLIKLDVLALRFDGYMALTRKSLAERLELSEESREKIAKAASELRELIVLPRFRWHFAAPLPNDIGFRDCLYAGSVCTQLNLKIIDLMTDQECERLHQTLVETLDQEVIQATEKLAVLPDGVWSLLKKQDIPDFAQPDELK